MGVGLEGGKSRFWGWLEKSLGLLKSEELLSRMPVLEIPESVEALSAEIGSSLIEVLETGP